MSTILSLIALIAIGWLFIKIAKAGLYAAIGVGVVSFGWATWYFGTGGILILCGIGLYYGFKYHPDNVKTEEPGPTIYFPRNLPQGPAGPELEPQITDPKDPAALASLVQSAQNAPADFPTIP